jgi:hypothetical protein
MNRRETTTPSGRAPRTQAANRLGLLALGRGAPLPNRRKITHWAPMTTQILRIGQRLFV